jgi:hypothetical protein
MGHTKKIKKKKDNSLLQGFSKFFVWRPLKNSFKIMQPNFFFPGGYTRDPSVPSSKKA